MNKLHVNLLIAAAMGMTMPSLVQQPQPKRTLTKYDLEATAKAKAKRERKAAKKATMR